MFHAVIMAGGKGTRFWPLSRAKKAKQFLEIVGKKTLLAHTIERIKPLVKDNVWIVGNRGQAEHLAEAKKTLPKQQVILEPFGRNTAPSIALAAIALLKKDPDAIMAVLPADHMIESPARFRRTIKQAFDYVQKHQAFVTIGIPPTFPHTGYGYIEAKTKDSKISPVMRFCEKPDLQTAQQFISQGNFYWNAGIFVWRAQHILDSILALVPDMQMGIETLCTAKTLSQKCLLESYEKMPNISIDYAVMEKSAAQTRVIPAQFTWDDIGNWGAMDNYWPHDANGNAHRGQVIGINSHNNIIHTHKTATLIDVDNMIVVETPDALLIAPKSSDQKIRELYDSLPKDLK
jgi:mannose-1-phosphate guanylyltransferase/mannose-6-phosphate isomerase